MAVSWVWRLLLTVYNILLAVLGAVIISIAAGNVGLLHQFDGLFATPYNSLFTGIIGGLLMIFAVVLLVLGLKRDRPESLLIEDSPFGEVCITVAAISEIITKAARGVEGVRDVQPAVTYTKKGVMIYLHLMAGPDVRLPELSSLLQEKVRDQVETLVGIKVVGVRILVDQPALRRAK
jgi:uncharacterized alkaline shock family protein YloU